MTAEQTETQTQTETGRGAAQTAGAAVPGRLDAAQISRALDTARRVIATEAAALAAQAEALDDRFAEAVGLMLRARGRVIVSGMGKSGHIARKIAATLASTGTPAQFVHPGEASHGDLGMITRDDVVLVLSNSGETKELFDIVAHSRRFSIPLIALVGRSASSLGRAADVALVLVAAPEACPNGLAPTTSTTLTLALGDALAVALMDRTAFTREHYAQLHPGGALGVQLLTVADIMHAGEALPLVSEETSMRRALVEMSAKGLGVVGVTDAQGRLVGVVTDGDLRRNMEGLLERQAGDVATRTPKTIASDALASEALALMNAPRRALCLFVLAPGAEMPARPVGLVHVHDCLRAGVDAGQDRS